jgi:DNA-binding MarR family transcriptional regulator
VLSNPIRLAIALYLLPREGAYFAKIARDLGLTRGNLRHHLDRLIEEGIIEEKIVFRNRPRKYISLTLKGAEELARMLGILEKITANHEEYRQEKNSRVDMQETDRSTCI